MKLKELMEVIVYVRDMEAQVCFYRDQLGFAVKYPEGAADFASLNWVTFETGRCVLALHRGGNGEIGPNPSRLVFRVTDIPDARKALVERGVRVGSIREAAPGILVCDALDPEGNPFSIESQD